MSSWSKLRKNIRQKIIPELQKRVDFHYTVYESKSHYNNMMETKNLRFWVTVDKKQVFSIDFFDYFKSEPVKEHEDEIGKTFFLDDAKKLGAIGADDFVKSLKEYLNLSIQEARSSEKPMIRALSFIDTRTGKRSFQKIEVHEDEHEIVHAFFRLRKNIIENHPVSMSLT